MIQRIGRMTVIFALCFVSALYHNSVLGTSIESRIAYLYSDNESDQAVTHLVFINPDGSQRVVLNGSVGDAFQEIHASPNRKLLMALRGDPKRIEIYDFSGTLKLTYNATIFNAAWANDSEFVFTGHTDADPGLGGESIWGYNLESSQEFLIAQGSSTDTYSSTISVSPDGQKIIFIHQEWQVYNYLVVLDYKKSNFPYPELDIYNKHTEGYKILFTGAVPHPAVSWTGNAAMAYTPGERRFESQGGPVWWSYDSTLAVVSNSDDSDFMIDVRTGNISDLDQGLCMGFINDMAHTSNHYLCRYYESLFNLDFNGNIRKIGKEVSLHPTWSHDDLFIIYQGVVPKPGAPAEDYYNDAQMIDDNRLVVISSEGTKIAEFPVSLSEIDQSPSVFCDRLVIR